MRTLLLTTATALVAATWATAVHSADFVDSAPDEFDWTGFYVGAHGGYMWGDSEASTGAVWESEPEGPFGGINAGYLFGSAPWVFGIGVDASIADVDDETANGNAEQEFDFFGSVHGRLGFGFDRFQIYGLGGVAFAHGERESNILAGGPDDDNIHVGWVAGVGGEFAMNEMFTVFAEYRHWEFDEEEYSLTPAIQPEVDLDADSVMGGIRIMF